MKKIAPNFCGFLRIYELDVFLKKRWLFLENLQGKNVFTVDARLNDLIKCSVDTIYLDFTVHIY